MSQCSKKNAIHMVKVFVEHILWEFVTHVCSNILHWHKVFGDKGKRKENSSVLLLIWKIIISVRKWV